MLAFTEKISRYQELSFLSSRPFDRKFSQWVLAFSPVNFSNKINFTILPNFLGRKSGLMGLTQNLCALKRMTFFYGIFREAKRSAPKCLFLWWLGKKPLFLAQNVKNGYAKYYFLNLKSLSGREILAKFRCPFGSCRSFVYFSGLLRLIFLVWVLRDKKWKSLSLLGLKFWVSILIWVNF